MASLNTYFYNACISKTIIAFGDLMSNLVIKRDDGNGVTQAQPVPISYGSSKKYIAILQNRPDVNDIPVAITLPRISFQMTGLSLDNERKLSPAHTFSAISANERVASFMPMPIQLTMELSILAKNQSDALQIIEQIIPWFHPSLAVSMRFVEGFTEERDVIFSLDNIGYQDSFEGDFTERAYLEWTLVFTARSYIFSGAFGQKDIRKVVANYRPNANFEAIGTFDRVTTEVVSTDIPPKQPQNINPTTDPYEIVKTVETLNNQ